MYLCSKTANSSVLELFLVPIVFFDKLFDKFFDEFFDEFFYNVLTRVGGVYPY